MRGAAAWPPAPETPRPPRRGFTLDAIFTDLPRVERSSPSRLARSHQAAATFTLRPPRGYHSAWKRTGPGGPPDLQNRPSPAMRESSVRLRDASATISISFLAEPPAPPDLPYLPSSSAKNGA